MAFTFAKAEEWKLSRTQEGIVCGNNEKSHPFLPLFNFPAQLLATPAGVKKLRDVYSEDYASFNVTGVTKSGTECLLFRITIHAAYALFQKAKKHPNQSIGVVIPPLPYTEDDGWSSETDGLRNLPFPGITPVQHGDPLVRFDACMMVGPHVCDTTHEFVPGKLKEADPDMVVLLLDTEENNDWKLRLLSK